MKYIEGEHPRGGTTRRLARSLLIVLALALVVGATGCASLEDEEMPEWSYFPDTADALPEAHGEPGAIYVAGRDVRYFEDIKARRVGDILTITLAERTDARKSASTSTSKGSELEIPAPTIAGGGVTVDGRAVFQTNIETDRSFTGQGDSQQSNSLNGDITVSVIDVMPNGNLVVQGEKWININRGMEFIRLTGLVRPFDVQTDNTVPSNRVANARIAYSGRGAVAQSNTEGWLSRFFSSPAFPL